MSALVWLFQFALVCIVVGVGTPILCVWLAHGGGQRRRRPRPRS